MSTTTTVAGSGNTIPSTAGDSTALKGSLGTFGLFFSIMSFNAPLVIVMGVIPIMVATGNGIGTPFIFIVGGAVVACFATTFLRMSAVLDRPGAFYAYVSAGLGRKMGLGAGLTMLLAYFTCACGYLAFAGTSVGSLVSSTFNGPSLPWYVWAFLIWALVGVLGYLRIDVSAKVMAVILSLEIVVVIVYDVVVFAAGGADGLSTAPFAPAHWFDGSFANGLLLACAMFGGYEMTVLFRDEVKRPERTIPRAAFGLIVFAVVLYAGTSWLYVNALGVDDAVAVSTAEGTAAFDATILEFGGRLLLDVATVLLVTSSLAVIICAHNVAARYLFNLGADGVVSPSVAVAHSRFGSPYRASMVVSVAVLIANLIVVVAGIDSMVFYGALLGIAALTGISVMVLTSIAVPVYLIRHDKWRGHVFASFVAPFVALIGFGWSVVMSIVDFSAHTGGVMWLSSLLIAIVYGVFISGFLVAMRLEGTKPDIYQRIGRQ
ncbi:MULTISPECIES: APC family permease [Rhodococcus]|uniref:APC family permease n=1 Tax=Rhodococcus oxybenzonivorans TaxID=1990687 RepID=A0AAE5A5K7_9NOCA|nr:MULTISPECIES: APC family permease [Rhodococcus]MDV7241692.1 APC family permease [Rhodococcus oxybenzonivorans]MDV7264697.1 APC family permease [Rhodococcus oxybenzonivorans]MDV7273774.1 APC family permease [Rhodococcus oxybenzonivorans]MDV7333974.1 APC family permease [Rhodococcus oxybenzonivorans]MDV7343393.1 APC family permease [Rhodococcus oxybenzonivorans]